MNLDNHIAEREEHHTEQIGTSIGQPRIGSETPTQTGPSARLKEQEPERRPDQEGLSKRAPKRLNTEPWWTDRKPAQECTAGHWIQLCGDGQDAIGQIWSQIVLGSITIISDY